ncbi:MAG: DUF411 domain-containing protein, partial [Alsobacter sp.]
MILTRRRAFAALGVVALARPAWAEAGPSMIVHKDPNCGCCTAWVEHVRSAGFVVEVRETTSMDAVKTRLRIPEALASCHTAEIGG